MWNVLKVAVERKDTKKKSDKSDEQVSNPFCSEKAKYQPASVCANIEEVT